MWVELKDSRCDYESGSLHVHVFGYCLMREREYEKDLVIIINSKQCTEAAT